MLVSRMKDDGHLCEKSPIIAAFLAQLSYRYFAEDVAE
jgi:hypothetical protein